MERTPWECPRCHRVNAPHADQCPCEPSGDVTAGTPAPAPTPPPATVSVTASPHGFWYGGGGGGAITFPGNTVTWVSHAATGGVLTASEVVARAGEGICSIGDMRRELGERPWGDSDAAA